MDVSQLVNDASVGGHWVVLWLLRMLLLQTFVYTFEWGQESVPVSGKKFN